jgi:XTP/dITP diphosphohydrolase
MKEILVATNNPGKLRELLAILGDLPLELVTPARIGLVLEVEESGTSYAGNARLKAEAFGAASGLLTLADDSGLEVEALGGAPGVFSARYAGEGASDADRRAKLLEALTDVPAPRTARFKAVISVRTEAGEVFDFEGVCPGEIAFEARGQGGFGYDPIFYLPEHQATMAELPEALKNQISHRGRAAAAARSRLLSLL